MFWIIHRYYIDSTLGIMQIFNVSHSDKGLYTCIARTSLDEDTSAALITVLGRNILRCLFTVSPSLHCRHCRVWRSGHGTRIAGVISDISLYMIVLHIILLLSHCYCFMKCCCHETIVIIFPSSIPKSQIPKAPTDIKICNFLLKTIFGLKTELNKKLLLIKALYLQQTSNKIKLKLLKHFTPPEEGTHR